MKKRIILAGVMAVCLAMSACKSTKGSGKITSVTTDSESSETSGSTEKADLSDTGTSDDTSSPDTDISSSADPKASQTPSSNTPSARIRKLDEDLYSLYADDTYEIPDSFICHLTALTSWSTDLTIDTKQNTFDGKYESAIMNLDGDGYDMLECIFHGTIDGFSRVNEYSFSTHVTKMETEKFDKKTDRYMDLPAEVNYSDPYGFTSAGEIILYLPNTPVSQIPDKAIEWIEAYQEINRNGCLGSFILYNPAEETAFMVLNSAIPGTRETEDADLAPWLGEYVDNHEGIKITIEGSSTDPKITVQRADSTYTDMHVKALQDKNNCLLIYGENDEGHLIIAGFGTIDQRTTLQIYESTDPVFPSAKYFYPKQV